MGTEQVSAAAMPYRGYNPWAYQGLVSCMDTTADITGSYPMPIGGGAFGPSVFGGCMPYGGGMPFCGGMPGMYGMYGMGGPGFEYYNMDTKKAMEYQNGLRFDQLDGGVEFVRRTQNAEHRASNNNNIVAEKAGVLQGLIKENNQDQISTAYENLKEAVREKLVYEGVKEPTEKEIETTAKTLYAKAMGANIPDELRKYGDSPFMSGFKKNFGIIGRFFMESKTATQNISEIDGTKVPASEKAWEYAGGAVALALTVAGAFLLHKGYKAYKNPDVLKVVTGATKAVNHNEELAKLRPLAEEYKTAAMKEIDTDSTEYFHQLYKDGDLMKEDGAGKACKAYQAILDKIKVTEEAQRAAKLKNAGVTI